MDFIKQNSKWIALSGLALAFIGCFLPFAKITVMGMQQSINYVDGGRDGIIVIIAAIIAAVLIFLKKEKFSSIASGIAALVTIYDMINVTKVAKGYSFANVSIGIGAFVIVIGAIVAIAMPFIPCDDKKTDN